MDHKLILKDFLIKKQKSDNLVQSHVFVSPLNEIMTNIAILKNMFKNDKKNNKNLEKKLFDKTNTYELNLQNLIYYMYFYDKYTKTLLCPCNFLLLDRKIPDYLDCLEEFPLRIPLV